MIYEAVQATSLAILLSRLRHGRHTVRARASTTDRRVSVVVPARNEARNIERCLAGLGTSSGELHEVIVVDDCSTDGTADIARRVGATVVEGAALPDGWVGKPWALQQGLDRATGDVVVFLDADTIARAGLIGALTDRLDDNDVVSFTARFVCDSVVETALHASLLATLVYRFGPPGAPLRPGRAIANGQCMAFRRDWLIEMGGFENNRSNMTDDIALVRRLSQRRARVAFVDGGDLLEVDMHRSVGDVWREWGRSLPMPDATSPASKMFDLTLLWVSIAMPWLRLLSGRANKVDYAFFAVRALLSVALLGAYKRHRVGVLLSDVLGIAALVRLTQATLRPVRTWKGRSYTAPGAGV